VGSSNAAPWCGAKLEHDSQKWKRVIESANRHNNPTAIQIASRTPEDPDQKRQNRPTRFCHTVQRRKIVANRGAEIGLKAASHPTGIFACGRDCGGATGDPGSGEFVTAAPGGKRSPLNVRSTLTG
jgi:hypothetical protein